LLLALALTIAPAAVQHDAPAVFDRGVEAYRRADFDAAEAAWLAVLEAELPAAERARVCYDLGNLAWREGRELEAVGWYTACIRLDPRHRDAWTNLELARAAAGLEPADRGDLRSTVRRLLGGVTAGEARGLALVGLLLLAAALAVEAFRGGRVARALVFATAVLTALLLGPWVYGVLTTRADPVICIEGGAASLRAEPRVDRDVVGSLATGEVAERRDTYPGWVRVETADGARGWVAESAVFPLAR
jgi:tetratricopeptide (TPR) repeat protein